MPKESLNSSELTAAAAILAAIAGCGRADVPESHADISINPEILTGLYSDGLEIKPGNCTDVFGKISGTDSGCPTNEEELKRTMVLHPDNGFGEVPLGERMWLAGAAEIAHGGRKMLKGIWMTDSTLTSGTERGAYDLCHGTRGQMLQCDEQVRLDGANKLQMRARDDASRTFGPWKSYHRKKR